MMRIAVCQTNIEKNLDWNRYAAKMEKLVSAAKSDGAHMLLMPEYAGTEICSSRETDAALYAAIQHLLPQYLELFKRLAVENQMYIQPGTILVAAQNDQYVNRAYFFGPDGGVDYQDKLQLIEYEKNTKLIARGSEQKLFETRYGKMGIAICYDSEFPEIVRRLVVAGATIILVPSYTTSVAGYYRVVLSCRARAIENQCFVAVAFAVGEVAVTEPPEQTYGKSGIFSPADIGFKDDGIVIESQMNETGIITADLDLKQLASIRENGNTLQYEDIRYCERLLNMPIMSRIL
ncbi:MAG TPA: carbon-nitrogen hydrolase family protein [Gammaproteobacteria bacterium]|jgi:predicted amidohydrolase|nr:carbon-nitrogen hydrolase family protein [Gammaproteobacteria bacterium]